MADTPERSELSASLQQSIAQSRKAFVASVADIRPRLHKFCTRMCGSVFDGEDVVQETLADAFYNLNSLKDSTRFESWLFRIAYNKCIDFLRRNKARVNDVSLADEHDNVKSSSDANEANMPIDEALVTLVSELPPKERAAVLMKDVLDYSLSETADVIDSTLGGTKAALHRARLKLATSKPAPSTSALDARQQELFAAYAECFNQRDWEALSRLVRADARLEIVGEARGVMSGLGASYHTNYTRLPWQWQLSATQVDSQTVIVHWRRTDAGWEPQSAIQLWWDAGMVVRIRDYVHVEYLLQDISREMLRAPQ